MDRIPTPTPLTAKELVEMQKQHELERQERLLTYDNTKVEAKLVYYKGTTAAVGTHSYLNKQFADIKKDWNSVIMIGTTRQRCADDTINNITGSYTLYLTDEMIKEYENNDKNLIII